MNNQPKKKKGLGFLIAILFLLLATGAGVLLTGGAALNFNNSIPPNQGQEFIPISPSPGLPDQNTDMLQLRTIDFKGCSSSATVDFLLDRTYSMNDRTPTGQSKIQRLKEAVLDLTSKLDDNSVIGIQSFNSLSITNDVPVSYYKEVKKIIPAKVNALQANGNTPTHDALAYSYNVLQNALPNFPNRKFNFILISDGAPCPGTGCPGNPGPDQDPRLYTPNPADEIKALGVNVFTLAVYEPSQAKDPVFSDLLKSIASTPANYYEAQSADQIDSLLQGISGKFCNQPAATPSATPSPVAQATPRPFYPTTCGTANQYIQGNECGPGNCVLDGAPSAANPCCPGVTLYNGHSLFGANAPDQWCDAKPVIYLYPTKPTNVSVKVTVPGKITLSIPQYQPETGWENILAYPDGTLTYQNNKYSELFYETAQEKTVPPAAGWIVKTSDLKPKLTEITSTLGLNNQEQSEFLAYWLPKLRDLNKPYVLISVFTKNEKQSIDKVDIFPKPDTFIQFIMYYKGIDTPFNIKPGELPRNIPQRNGFTAVEWGGILDH